MYHIVEEGEDTGARQEEDYYCRDITYCFGIFYFGANSISEEVSGFSPLCFPQGKFFMSLVSCVLLLCMLFSQLKILRS